MLRGRRAATKGWKNRIRHKHHTRPINYALLLIIPSVAPLPPIIPAAMSSNQQNAKKSKKKKVAILGDSGQTEEERRELRSEQRSLQRTIASDLGDDMENPELNAFQEICGKNNDLWKKVRYVREAVLDSDNLEMISARATKQTKHLDEAARYDPMKVARRLREKCTAHGAFDWELLGREVGACFNAIPGNVVFFSGPVAAEYKPKERKQRAPRAKEEEEVEEEAPEELKKMEKSADNMSAVEKHMKNISKKLKQRCREEAEIKLAELENVDEDEMDEECRKKRDNLKMNSNEEICAVKFLFDPKSFTQTVENIFHFSFLVKEGKAGISVSKDGEPKVAHKIPGAAPTRQAIVPISMKDWKTLVEAYKVTSCDIAHRTGSKHERTSTGADNAEMSSSKRQKSP